MRKTRPKTAAPPPTLTARIRDRYSELRPAERRIADLILNFPGEIAGYTATELAKMAQTSNAAVSRFVQRVGFETYEEMRVLTRDIKMAGSPLYQMDSAASPEVDGTLSRHLDMTISALGETCSSLSDALIEDIAAAMVAARRVWIVGYRHSHFLAAYFHWQLIHVRPDARLLPVNGATLGETLVDIEPGDIVVAFAMRRRPQALALLLGVARDAGAKLLVVADLGFADDLGAKWTIRCDTRQRGPVDNHAPVLFICQVLLDGVILRSGAAARRRFGRIDEFHEALDEL